MDGAPSSSGDEKPVASSGPVSSVYDEFIAHLRASGVGEGAPVVGEQFPDFALPNDRGRYRTLMELTDRGPLVLSFNRGGWCPYCVDELTAWGDASEALAKAGGHFASIAGEVGGRAERLHGLIGEAAEVLVDVDHGLALAVGLAFRCSDALQRRYLERGLDLAAIYGSPTWILPVPATFIIGGDRQVHYAFVEPDFRLRADPDDVIARVAAFA